MKKIIMSAIVEDGTEEEISQKLRAVVALKNGTVDIQVSDAPPEGSGVTLAGVA